MVICHQLLSRQEVQSLSYAPVCPGPLQGHVHSLSRQYTEALCAYFGAYRFLPTEPLLLLCIAVTYTNLATAKRCPDRNRNVLNAFAFMQVCDWGRETGRARY